MLSLLAVLVVVVAGAYSDDAINPTPGASSLLESPGNDSINSSSTMVKVFGVGLSKTGSTSLGVYH